MAGLHPQNIGATMPHGFAGSYARQPDMIVGTRIAGGDAAIDFGAPLEYDAKGNVVPMGASSTAAQFVGVASCELKSALTYLEQAPGRYMPGEPTAVFQRGAVNVHCQKGTPKLGGPVYVRVAANASVPSAKVGGFEAEADATPANTVKLTNCQWSGTADANGIAEMRIMAMINA